MRILSRIALIAAALALSAALVFCGGQGWEEGPEVGPNAAGLRLPDRALHPLASFNPVDPDASGMVLTFDDEFNELSASRNGAAYNTRWTYQADASPANVSVHDGVLDMISGSAAGWPQIEMTTINAEGRGFAQRYGYFEVRFKWARGRGLGGAFYAMSQAHMRDPSAPAAELDVIEVDPDHPTNTLTTLHRDSAHPGDEQNPATGGSPYQEMRIDLSQDFHTYGALWAPNSATITWYVDGRAVMTQPKYDTTDLSPMFFDMIAGRNPFADRPDRSTPDPAHTYYDYVRVWQFPDQHPQAVRPQAVSPPFIAAARPR